MGTAAGIAILLVLGVVYFAYAQWLTNGIKPRTFTTRLSKAEVRNLFEQKVARAGWKIVDDGNPMLAQSHLATGIRQQIALTVETDGERTMVRVGPHRWVTSWGVPKKAHTLRLRMDGFVNAVHSRDAAVVAQREDLRSR